MRDEGFCNASYVANIKRIVYHLYGKQKKKFIQYVCVYVECNPNSTPEQSRMDLKIK